MMNANLNGWRWFTARNSKGIAGMCSAILWQFRQTGKDSTMVRTIAYLNSFGPHIRCRYAKNGGMRFLRIHRLQLSWCVCKAPLTVMER